MQIQPPNSDPAESPEKDWQQPCSGLFCFSAQNRAESAFSKKMSRHLKSIDLHNGHSDLF